MTLAPTFSKEKVTYLTKQFLETRDCNRLQTRNCIYRFWQLFEKSGSQIRQDSRRYGNELTFLIHFTLWTRRC